LENSITKLILFLLLFSGSIFAQQDTAGTDTADNLPGKSPAGAVLRSAVLPGWGQIYNESYWKAPVVWGFLGYFGYVWIDNNNKYKEGQDFYARTGNKLYRDFYRDQRDLFAIYIGITYVLTLLDAYVDAHLFNFNVEEDMITGSTRLKMQLNFNSIFR